MRRYYLQHREDLLEVNMESLVITIRDGNVAIQLIQLAAQGIMAQAHEPLKSPDFIKKKASE